MFRLVSRIIRPEVLRDFPKRVWIGKPCWIHYGRPPYTGPPTYETIARRFSSDPDPQVYFIQKRQHEAIERNKTIDIHDIGRDPDGYDVLLTDINNETLGTVIAEELGIPYLSVATECLAKEVIQEANGYMHGPHNRAIVPLVVRHKSESRWVFFIIDSGAPLTYLSIQASKLFGIVEGDITPVTIGGHPITVYMSPSGSHFGSINLLGTDFCSAYKICVTYDYKQKRVKLVFDK